MASSGYRSVTSGSESQWERARQLQSLSFSTPSRPRGPPTDSAAVLEAELPLHLSSLNRSASEESLSTALRLIRISLEGITDHFPYSVMFTFRAHEPLLDLLATPNSDEDIAETLAILCRHYMSDRDGCRLLGQTDFPGHLLRMLAEGQPAACAGSLFVGLAFEISADSEFKQHFIESGFIRDIKAAYEQLEAESPNFEIVELVKSILRPPIEDGWKASITHSLLPILADLAADGSALARRSFQAVRTLLRTDSAARSLVLEAPFLDSLMAYLLSETVNRKMLKTYLSVLPYLVADDTELARRVVSAELLEAVDGYMELIENVPRDMNYALIDLQALVFPDFATLTLFVESELFRKVAKLVDSESPFILWVQAGVIVCRLMATKTIGIMEAAFHGGLFLRGLEAVLQVDHVPTLVVGLRALSEFCTCARDTANVDWVGAVRDSAWIAEQLDEIAQSEDTDVREWASFLLRYFEEHEEFRPS